MTQVFLEAMEGWLFELVRQLPVLAWLSSALLCPLNIRWTLWQLLVYVELRGALRCLLSSLDRLTKFPAPFARRWHKNAPKPSHPRWRQYSITCRHRQDKQSPTSNARPCAPRSSTPRSSAPVSPWHSRTNKVRLRTLGPPRHGPPHQSLPDIPGQTKSDLERSALRASLGPVFRIFPL